MDAFFKMPEASWTCPWSRGDRGAMGSRLHFDALVIGSEREKTPVAWRSS